MVPRQVGVEGRGLQTGRMLAPFLEPSGVATESPRGHGLNNLANRAMRHGGACELRAREGGRTVVEWRVPFG